MSRYDTLVPRPRETAPAGGSFELTADTGLYAGFGAEEAAAAVRVLLAPLRLPLAPTTGPGANTLAVRVDPAITEAEGFRLQIEPERIDITAAGIEGVRHATQVLRQLLPDDAWRHVGPPDTRWRVECGTVVDPPAYGWRGGMIDVARYFHSKQLLLRYIDLFAMHRLNRLHLHLTDDQGWRIESRLHPEVHEIGSHRPHTQLGRGRDAERHDGTPHGGYYTLADLTEIAVYAAERGITVVPEIDLPGHASALLAARPDLGVGRHQVLTGWGISSGVLKPVPATIDLVRDLIGELMEAVPTPYIHLGGDECVLRDWGTDSEVTAYMRELGIDDPVQMHGRFLRELGHFLAEHDRRMVVWDEGYVTGGMLPDTIVTAWRGDSVTRRAAAAGYEVVRCPLYPTYLNYNQSDSADEPLSIGGPIHLSEAAQFAPVPHDWTEVEAAQILGAQFQAWSEYIPDEPTLDYMVFPRACTIADVAWTGHPSDLTDSSDRLRAQLGRLDVAGVGYRPLEGPRPWQKGGTGNRREVEGGHRIAEVREYLDRRSDRADVERETTGTSSPS